jgi:3-hydroxyisobutyrate dehydrogenase-like beta-hydroxyacid dehydrogenase
MTESEPEPEPAPARVGFIGLGQIGAPMAGHLVDHPGGLVVCDVRPEATAPLAERGATVAATPAEVAEAAEIVSVMVLDDEQVRAVVGELVSSARPGTVVAVHSTIRAETAVELAATAAAHGVHVVDAPVSGGFIGAHRGTLAVMVGGSDEAYERCREPFGRWAGLVVHLGPVGAGTRAKLARNLMHFVAFTAAGEAQRLAEAAGIDLLALARVVRHSDAVTGGPGAIMLRDTTAPMASDDDWYDTLDHVRVLGEKDLSLALALGRDLGVDLPLAELAHQRFAASLGLVGGPAATARARPDHG